MLKPPFPSCLYRPPLPWKLLPPTVGSGVNPVFIVRGQPLASISDVGDTDSPVYLKKGVITECSLGDTYIAYSALRDGGGIAADDDGNVYVDSSVYIPYTALLEGGGLVTDDDGNVYVDFSEMDTTIFENLLKALEVPIYITANKPFYVDGENGSDDLDDGRGESSSLPFKTIQACINYVTKYYAVGSYTINIYVAAGTYDETLTLGLFTRTTGYIKLQSLSGEQDVYITHTYSGSDSGGKVVECAGAGWIMQDMNIVMNCESQTGSGSVLWRALGTEKDSELEIRGVNITAVYSGDEPVGGVSMCAIVATYGSTITVSAYSADYPPLTIAITRGDATSVTALSIGNSSNLYFGAPTNSTNITVCEGSGDVDTWCSCFARAMVKRMSSSSYGAITWQDNGSTGKRYSVTEGGCCTGLGSTEYFPGDTDGTVATATYCFYT